MIVAITGATGFIGSELVKLHVSRGDKVRVISRKSLPSVFPKSVQIFQADLTDSSADLNGFLQGVEVLYHCAAEVKNQELMHDVNVLGTKRLIVAASGKVKRWVNLSSVGAYGIRRYGVIDEKTEENPTDDYELTKTIADNLVREASAKGAFDAVILRPSIVYGQLMTNQSLFQLISMIEKRLFFYIGCQTYSANYVHVSDVVKALYMCATHPKAIGKTYNLSNWSTIAEAVEAIKSGLGVTERTSVLPELPLRAIAKMASFIPSFPLKTSRIDALTSQARYSSQLICEDLGFEPDIDNTGGMKALAEYWKINKK